MADTDNAEKKRKCVDLFSKYRRARRSEEAKKVAISKILHCAVSVAYG